MISALRMALRSIANNKLRAVLTMLGIIIGVMALVVLVSLVNGATSSVNDAISSLGGNFVTVSINDDKGQPLSMEELNGWTDKTETIGVIAPYRTEIGTAKYQANNDSITIYGTTSAYFDIQNLSMSLGRFMKNSDLENNTRVCMINETAATELVGFVDCIGEEISLNGMKFTIVGVLEDDEDSLTSVFQAGNLVAYIPYTTFLRLSDNATIDVTSFYIMAGKNSTVEQAKEAVEAILYERLDEDEDAYTIFSTDAIESAMDNITSVLAALLGGIAAISLIVGGIGIMNIMLVTVTERTREIGIRKAIGAKRRTILGQFLTEAVVLCMIGCAAGIFLSWSLLRILNVVVASLNITFKLDGGVVITAVLFCLSIGLLFGLYPANKAAKMKPIDALHYNG